MSACEVIEFKDGKPDNSLECPNAWGGAAYIWTALYEVYCKDPLKQYDSWLMKPERVWELYRRKDIPMNLRRVLISTFDYAVVYPRDFKQFAQDLRAFVTWAGTRNCKCHLLTWADFVEKSTAEAIGFYGTSVAENLWYSYDKDKDESVPYDLKTGAKHFDVYEEITNEVEEP